MNSIQTNSDHAFLGGGAVNSILTNAEFTVLVGGEENTIQGNCSYAFLGGGFYNTINTGAGASFLGGGQYNSIQANATYAVIGGGWGNSAAGTDATIPGGANNQANGEYSFAAGQQAQALHQGAFVWADSQESVFASTANDQFLIRASGGVGIGTTGPQAPLHVVGRIITGSAWNTAGAVTFYPPNGSGWLHIDNPGTPTGRLRFSTGAGPGGTELMTISQNGNVGIGTTSPDATLTVNGTADKPGGGSWSTFSDGRLKDVGPRFAHGLAALEGIQPFHYHYRANNPLSLPSQPEYVGVVAQQVQNAVPEAVQRNKDGYLVVNNDPIIWTMVNAIKELNQKRETEAKEKDAEIQELKQSVAELKAMVEKLAGK